VTPTFASTILAVSFHRYLTRAPYDAERRAGRRAPSGRPICRWCGAEAAKGRTSWCSDACEKEYLIRVSSSAIRAAVFARDGGVCACCGLHVLVLDALLDWLDIFLREPGDPDTSWLDVRRGRAAVGNRIGRPLPNGSIWQADHIVPVAEGGGACGLDNLRTLCWRCHGRETGRLRRRLNRTRGPQIELPLDPSESSAMP